MSGQGQTLNFAGLGALLAAVWLWWAARGAGVFDGAAVIDAGAVSGGGDLEPKQPGVIEQMTNTVMNVISNPSGLSAAGLAMLAQAEGFSAVPYSDFKGYSIGYGHLIKAGESFGVIDEAQGRALLASDVGIAERAVLAVVTATVTQEQFDALVMLAYNIGAGAFKRSTLVKLLNAGDTAGAQAQFERWKYAGGVVNAGLVARRALEADLFSGGAYV